LFGRRWKCHATRPPRIRHSAGCSYREYQEVLTVSGVVQHFGAKKCSERLLPTNRLLLLPVLCSKTRNAKSAPGNIQTHTALLLGQRLQTKKPNGAAIVVLKNHSLASTPDNERACPTCDQMDDSIIAVPKSAMARFRRNVLTVRKTFPTTVLPRLGG